MTAVKQLITTVTVGAGGAANVVFSSIPQNFTDLQIVSSSRTDANPFGVAVNQIGLSANGGTPGWDSKALGGNGSSVYSETGSGTVTNSSISTANAFANGVITILNYAGAIYKVGSANSTIETNATLSWMALHSIRWPSTSAITSLSLYPVTGNFVQYSTFSLYGITNGDGGATVS